MAKDLLLAGYWWGHLFLINLIFFPLVSKFFAKFWDRGWIFAKSVGMVLIAYSVFLLGRLHLLPFVRETIWLVIVAWLTLLGFLVNKRSGFKKKNFRFFQKAIILEEGLFLLAFLFWVFIRGFQPDIEGLEKFMDFGFLNAVLRSWWFPPYDMWFAGKTINYYYFGHLVAGVLTKLSGLPARVTYNLMIATLFGLTFVSAFSLATNLVFFVQKNINWRQLAVVGGVSALLLTLGGNLHTLVYVVKEGPDRYWYPDATRFIGYRPNNPNDKTIHEFPAYSFVVADLHGHLNDLPVVMAFLALLVAWGKISFRGESFFLLASFLLGIMYMTNSWDLPIYLGLLVCLVGVVWGREIKRRWWVWGEIMAKILVAATITALPFALSFTPMSKGIGLVHAHSLWWQLLILWGFFWLLSFVFWAILFKTPRRINWSDKFVLLTTIWATILIFIPEIVYLKDIYIPEYHRANTMFKLTYQAFVLFAVSSGYLVWRSRQLLAKEGKKWLGLYSWLVILGIAAQMMYPWFAIKGYYGKLTNWRGLDGLKYLANLYPGEYQAISWLNQNVKGVAVVLEAVGDSYTHYNRISALTGLPTIQGWLVHEWLWRGSFDEPGKRAAEVEAIYQGEDEEYVRQLLKKYKVRYVVIGALEREKYPQLNEERFVRLGRLVFEHEGLKIYQIFTKET